MTYHWLVDITDGGPPKAFWCTLCGDVTKTEHGMRWHLERVHHIVVQPKLEMADGAAQET